MSDALIKLLKENPNCRVTIRCGNSKPRKQAKEGDIKFSRGRRMVRRHQMYDRCCVVRRGHYQYEWHWEPLPPEPGAVHRFRNYVATVIESTAETVTFDLVTKTKYAKGIKGKTETRGLKDFLDVYKPIKNENYIQTSIRSVG